MNIAPITMLSPQSLNIEKQADTGDKSFSKILSNALEEVNQAELKSDEITKSFLVGDIQDIHQVTIAAEQARLTMQLAMEIRNKVVEAYQEMSRMQV